MIVFFTGLLCRECFVEKHFVLVLYLDFLSLRIY